MKALGLKFGRFCNFALATGQQCLAAAEKLKSNLVKFSHQPNLRGVQLVSNLCTNV